MSKLDDVNRLIEKAVAEMGGLDYLVNNAAVPFTRSSIPPSDVASQSDEFWGKIVNLNLIGPYRAIRAAQQYLAKSRGVIVNVASTAAFGGGDWLADMERALNVPIVRGWCSLQGGNCSHSSIISR